jgi:hypothetical protein
MQLRAGIPTASEFDQLVTPGFEIRKGEMPRTYLAKKLAEWWLGGPIATLNTFDMDQGQVLEEEALPFFELVSGLSLRRVGFITNDDGTYGCSPDGLLDDGSGIEIKCPAVHTHTKYLLNGDLPPEYGPQVHGAMFVTGAQSWRFLSYCRRFPALNLVVARDEEKAGAIAAALSSFLRSFSEAKDRLIEVNGGEPKRP